MGGVGRQNIASDLIDLGLRNYGEYKVGMTLNMYSNNELHVYTKKR